MGNFVVVNKYNGNIYINLNRMQLKKRGEIKAALLCLAGNHLITNYWQVSDIKKSVDTSIICVVNCYIKCFNRSVSVS